MSEIGVGFVNRLVLTHEATQFLAEGAGARLERGIGEPLRWFDRAGRGSRNRHQEHNRDEQPSDHQESTDPAGITAVDIFDTGIRRRRRRSLSDTRPPKAARIAPNQIHGTSGL